VGDLLLLGMPLHAHVVALRAGHALHLEFVRRLRRLAATAHFRG
jgi:UDP-3-O-[3-hydroxymyristoyl] N-acetylglucosamine deacetylase